MSEYTVSKVKTFRGREGYGFNAELLRDGSPIAFVIDEANGGVYHFEWHDCGQPRIQVESQRLDGSPLILKCTPEESKLRLHVKGKTIRMMDKDYNVDMDMFVGILVDEFETHKRIKRAMAKKR